MTQPLINIGNFEFTIANLPSRKHKELVKIIDLWKKGKLPKGFGTLPCKFWYDEELDLVLLEDCNSNFLTLARDEDSVLEPWYQVANSEMKGTFSELYEKRHLMNQGEAEWFFSLNIPYY